MTYIKKTSVYVLKGNPALSDYVIGTDSDTNNGKTKNFSMGAIANVTAQIIGIPTQYTALISVDSIVQVGDTVTVTNATWKVNGEIFEDISEEFIITPAADETYRTDIIVGDGEGVLRIIQGTPDMSNPVQPPTPFNEVLVGVINVYGDNIVPEVPATDDFMKKSDEAQQDLVLKFEINKGALWTNRNTFRYRELTLSQGNRELDYTVPVTDFLYDGRLMTIVNGTDYQGLLFVNHLSGTAPAESLVFFNPGQRRFVLRPGAMVTYKYSLVQNRMELYSYSSNVIEEGYPLTPKFASATQPFPYLQPGMTCFGQALITDPDSDEQYLADIVTAIYDGPDPLLETSYRFLNYTYLNN